MNRDPGTWPWAVLGGRQSTQGLNLGQQQMTTGVSGAERGQAASSQETKEDFLKERVELALKDRHKRGGPRCALFPRCGFGVRCQASMVPGPRTGPQRIAPPPTS